MQSYATVHYEPYGGRCLRRSFRRATRNAGATLPGDSSPNRPVPAGPSSPSRVACRTHLHDPENEGAILDQLETLQEAGLVDVYVHEPNISTRNLPSRFWGPTERGVEVLYEHNFLRGVPGAVYEETNKSEKVRRHETAPRPSLPDAVQEALQFEEPVPEELNRPNSVVEAVPPLPPYQPSERSSDPSDRFVEEVNCHIFLFSTSFRSQAQPSIAAVVHFQ